MTKPIVETVAIRRLRNLKHNYFAITFGPFSQAAACRPGSFVHVRIPHSDIYFRRAMSVAASDPRTKSVEIIFKVFGRGTTLLSQLERGDVIDVLGPLGVPFAWPPKAERVVMVAGGVGFPPLLFLAERLRAKGLDPRRIDFYYGARTREELVERARIKALGVNLYVVTDDGSMGEKGLVTGPLEKRLAAPDRGKIRLYACGPEPMLKAVDALGVRYNVPGQVSLEAPMPCGIGVCLGCVVPLNAGGYARVCCDGPVFQIGEVRL